MKLVENFGDTDRTIRILVSAVNVCGSSFCHGKENAQNDQTAS